MSYKLNDRQLLLSDSRTGLLGMFGLIALGTGCLVMIGLSKGPDAANMMKAGAAQALLGLALLLGAWTRFVRVKSTWSRLVQLDPIPGTVVSRTLIPGKYGGTLLVFEHTVDGRTYQTRVQGSRLEPHLERLAPGDTVDMVVDPARPADARMRDWIASPLA